MSRRTERVSDVIRDALAELLQRSVRDPRLQHLVSITEVEVMPDLKSARVHVSVLGSKEEQDQAIQALNAARGFLRRELGPKLTLRYTPELHFRLDTSIERGARILQLLKEIDESTPDAGGPNANR